MSEGYRHQESSCILLQDDQADSRFFVNLWHFTKLIPDSLRGLFQVGIKARLPPSHATLYMMPSSGVDASAALSSMWKFRTIFQTDKEATKSGDLWVSENPGWNLEFYNDKDADRFVRETFPPAEPPKDKNGHEVQDVAWAWSALDRGVLRADMLRYLLPLVKGGVYVDTDTQPVAPIAEWGQEDVQWYNVNRTDGPNWHAKFADQDAAIVLGVDVDVHSDLDWQRIWPRPLGICQWALASAPAHPILLEVVRRVVRNTAYVRAMREYEESKKALEAQEKSFRAAKARLEEEGRTALQIDRPLVQHDSPKEEDFDHLGVINWTGPGVFTDAVMAYLLARYRVSWKDLRGLTRPTRIGEVLILPITAFSPGGHKDFGAGLPGSPQNALVHHFQGSWKGE